MMKPRSAPLTAITESITKPSTSSSTRPEPRARNPSRSAATCRRSLTTAEVVCSVGRVDSVSKKTISAPPLRPRRMRSPCASVCSFTWSPLTEAP